MDYLLDLDPMTLILKLDLDVVKIYLYTENEIPVVVQKLQSIQLSTHTDLTEIITNSHTRMATNEIWQILADFSFRKTRLFFDGLDGIMPTA